MMEAFNNDSIRRIICVRRRDCVLTVNLRLLLCLISIPALFVQGRLHCILVCCNMSRRWADLPRRMWRTRAGGQLKTWATTIKADLEPISRPQIFGHTRWRKDWVKMSSERLRPRRGQCCWRCRLNPPRLSADASTSKIYEYKINRVKCSNKV